MSETQVERGKLIIRERLTTPEQNAWSDFLFEANRPPVYSYCSLGAWETLVAGATTTRFGRFCLRNKLWFLSYCEESDQAFAQGIAYLKVLSGIKSSLLELYGLTIRESNEHKIRNFLQTLIAFAVDAKAMSVRLIRPNLPEINAGQFHRILKELGFEGEATNEAELWSYTRVIDLSPSEEEILGSFRERCRARRARRRRLRSRRVCHR